MSARRKQFAVLRGLVGGLVAMGFSAPSAADTVDLPADRDNSIFSEIQQGEKSNGAGDYLFAGRTKDGFDRRALLRFDVSSIPAGSVVTGATVTLYMSRTKTGGQDVSLHRALADWGEAGSHAAGEEGTGAPAQPGDATWTYHQFDTQAWASSGGDFVGTPSATSVVGNQTTFYSWSSAGLIDDVQDWLDGTEPNHGWFILGNESATRVVKRFDSRSNGDANRRPVLQVVFDPPSATGACCAADGSCSVVLDPGTTCSGSYQGVGSMCEPNPCPPPSGACCIPDAAATCLDAETESSCTAQGGTFQGALSLCTASECPVIPTAFEDPLPLPAVAQPVSGTAGGAASYDIAMREVQQTLHSELPPTTVWGYGDGAGASFPGPTIEARVGEPVTVTWINDLRDTSTGPPHPLRSDHYLPVDLCPHGASENAAAKTVVHVHGAHVESDFDGQPELTFGPGEQRVYEYPNWQLPATLWYHDHALGITRLNVYMGLAGLYLLRDAFEESLELPSGEFEIPLAIQDRSFHPDGSFKYPSAWEELFFGEVILVNGKVWPYLNVKQGKYRFRILSGSTSRTLTLSLSTGAPFQQIGAEGGLLPAPTTLSQITLGSGERADVVVDFAPYPAGTEIFLVNSAPAPFPGQAGVGVVPDVMKFVVGSEPGHTAALPATLRPMEVLDEADAVVEREFHLEKGPGGCTAFEWEIRSIVNGSIVGQKWDDLTEFPELEDTEVWKFVNLSGMTHPMHMHLVMFQVLDRQAFEVVEGEITPIGSPVPPPAHEAGWKDTVQVGPNEIVRVIARFENYTGLYPYHCHILEHEDHEMMRQFQTVAPNPACQDGVDNDGDGRTDFNGGDPGCDDAADVGEHAATLPCDDGIDNDGDGRTDFDPLTLADPAFLAGSGDPGCRSPESTSESPECSDGVDNADPDTPALADWDGAGLGAPDPECVGKPWWSNEASTCGDALLDAGEACDDGNNTAGDCCAADCQFAPGPGTPPCCSLGVCEVGEACGAVCFASEGVCAQPGGPGTACTCVAP